MHVPPVVGACQKRAAAVSDSHSGTQRGSRWDSATIIGEGRVAHDGRDTHDTQDGGKGSQIPLLQGSRHLAALPILRENEPVL